jgi:predicted unusual protein kinase regulating ubiquinone biosynthesis (AarF/ABC1/UbiB family)
LKPPAKPVEVPAGRAARLVQLGGLVSGIAGRALADGVRQLARGQRPQLSDLMLTPANARRVADQLARLRGAAMKVGQLLSMDAGDLMPRELAEIMARLRADAHPMPMSQLADVLTAAWGKDWDQRFSRFSFTPLAAASIGQVHSATLRDGTRLAIKVQYPGVRQSIDSDVGNVALLFRVSGLLPRGLDLDPLLAEAKRQLHDEADYRVEAGHLRSFGRLLEGRPEFVVPRPFDELTTDKVLAMSFVDGAPIESLGHASQADRDRAIGLLFELLFLEIFRFECVQTDPNFANYRVMADGRLALLDFGATRAYAPECVAAYGALLDAGCRSDMEALDRAAAQLGYFDGRILASHRAQVLELLMLACEPLRQDTAFDFRASDLGVRMRDAAMRLGFDREFLHTPPIDAIFLHRKVAGLYLLATRLEARVNVGALFREACRLPSGLAVTGDQPLTQTT